MPPMNVCCPKCLAVNVRAQLVQNGHEVSCENSHKFIDSVELFQSKLEPFSGPAFTPPKPPPPPSVSTVSVVIDSKINAALQSRFGDKFEASMVSIVCSMADPGAFIVNGEDAQRISQSSGQAVKDGMTLAGAVFSGFNELRQAKEKIKALESSPSGSNGSSADSIQIQLNMETVIKIAEKAAFNGKSVKAYVSEMIEYALQQGWM